MKKDSLKLAISIVIFNPDLVLLERVLDSIKIAFDDCVEKLSISCNIDLVDNNPKGNYFESVARLISGKNADQFTLCLIKSPRNGGYGFGNNLSIQSHHDSDFHLVLNPDIILSRSALSNAFAYLLNNPNVGLLTPMVRGLDGQLHYLCKENPTLLDMFIRSNAAPCIKSIFRNRVLMFEMKNRDYSRVIAPVPYPTGCFMLFRKNILNSIGGFDEGYFLHYEDADIGRKVSLISLAAYVPDVMVIHKWSRDTHKSWGMRLITIRSGLRYWWKWNVQLLKIFK